MNSPAVHKQDIDRPDDGTNGNQDITAVKRSSIRRIRKKIHTDHGKEAPDDSSPTKGLPHKVGKKRHDDDIKARNEPRLARCRVEHSQLLKTGPRRKEDGKDCRR